MLTDLTNDKKTLRNRVKGALYAAIVCDAYGSPRQFKAKMATDRSASPDMEPCDTFRCGPGFFTDDGSQVLCSLDSFNRCGGKFDKDDFAMTMCRWLEDGYLSSMSRSFDVGGATASALMHYAKTGSFIGPREDTLGNGSLMRAVAPSIIAMHEANGCESKEIEIVNAASDVTHNAIKVRESIAVFHHALRDILLTGNTEIGNHCASKFTYKTVPMSGFVLTSLDAALWAYHTYESFEDGARALASASGDSDTICSIYGALKGAKLGFDAIPKRWLAKMQKLDLIEEIVEKFLANVGLGKEVEQ